MAKTENKDGGDEQTTTEGVESASAVLPVDSTEREGNDAGSLVGSGVPIVTVRANASVMGIQAGESARMVQTEELRLNVQNGNLTIEES